MSVEMQALIREQRGQADLSNFSLEKALDIYAYHKTIPAYAETKLCSLDNLAKYFEVKKIFVKDESSRFNLNAFKGLGAGFAAANVLAKKAGLNKLGSFTELLEAMKAQQMPQQTFVTATDGNHGRGVAWIAKQLGQRAVVYMPEGTVSERFNNIKALGADVEILPMNYDDAVRYSKDMAAKNNWIVVQDTSWEGYEEIPLYIMQGYITMAYEAHLKLTEQPTHIFVQAGVGSMAAAIQAFFENIYVDNPPKVIVVEASKADCFYKTAQADDGNLYKVDGELDTIMAGLACGEANPIAWDILSAYAYAFLSVNDSAAAQGMRILANPLGDDEKIVAGESGASAFGAFTEIMRRDSLKNIREQLGLNSESVVLFFNTEGDTDKENYRRIVWDGAYSDTE